MLTVADEIWEKSRGFINIF